VLAPAAASLRLGATPSQALAELADDPATEDLGRLLTRALEGGAAPADVVRRLAADRRAAARAAATEDVQRVGVAVVAPLGLCFLPAFVLLGVVPIVAGVAGRLLA
jgi:pilus assembly protein TadC